MGNDGGFPMACTSAGGRSRTSETPQDDGHRVTLHRTARSLRERWVQSNNSVVLAGRRGFRMRKRR